MDIELLNKMLAEKYISVQKHPTENLFIYNYTPKAQYERVWNEATLNCRGLIADENFQIVSRPFGKFFNLEELQPEQIPNLPFEIFDKEDGSLGILYWVNDKPFIATRGSFTSEQAIRGTKILQEKYWRDIIYLEKDKTYLFEIIYPENQIVLSYGEMEDLILLAVRDTKTNKDLSLKDFEFLTFPKVGRYDGINDYKEMVTKYEGTAWAKVREGFVIKFSNDFRLKMKFKEYVRLHRIITQCSNVTIWEHLSEGRELNELLTKVPDEFNWWVKETIEELSKSYSKIEAECSLIFGNLTYGLSRKEYAEYFNTQKYPQVLFKMLDGKEYNSVIWKLIKPKFSKPFNKNIEI